MGSKRIRINWSVWGFLLVFSIAGALVFSSVSASMPGPDPETGVVPIATTVLNIVSSAFRIITLGLVLIAGASLGMKLLDASKKAVSLENAPLEGEIVTLEEMEKIVPFYSEIRNSQERMMVALRDIQQGRRDADERIQDAVEQSNSLARLAQEAVREIKQMEEEYNFLIDIAGAIAENDQMKMAEARGTLSDQGLRDLVIMAELDNTRAERARKAIMVQAGTLTQQIRATGYLVGSWLDRFEDARAEIGRLSVVAKRLEAGEHLLMIDSNLTTAQIALRAYQNPDTVAVVEQLPDADRTRRSRPRLIS